jgi:hypothetical protein
MESYRSKIIEALPTAGLPQPMRNWSEYVWLIDHLIKTRFISSNREIWWDLRPHGGFGTIEMRVFDMPLNLKHTLGMVALTQALVATLADQLDPEDFREVTLTYQTTCAEVIQRYDGHIAQYLGDGLLVYFGYPSAHEDDAQRAIHAGLDMLAALADLNHRLGQSYDVRLHARVGIHTGLVVVGEAECFRPVGGLRVWLAQHLTQTDYVSVMPEAVRRPHDPRACAVLVAAVEQQPGGQPGLEAVERPLRDRRAAERAEHHPAGQQVTRPSHFGFSDGISQPAIAGEGPAAPGPPEVLPGAFVLGHPSQGPGQGGTAYRLRASHPRIVSVEFYRSK